MARLMMALVMTLALACNSSGKRTDSGSVSDTGDTAGGGGGDGGSGSGVASLAALSSGECPDLSATGTSTFQSSDTDRQVTVVIPSTPTPDMPVVFFFHGLLDGSLTSPGSLMASGLNLQGYADELGAVFVLPDSGVMSAAGMSFYMWSADLYDGPDIILYDDLRTCIADQLTVDLDRFTAMGFSGGGIFTTVVARDRGDTLASIIELSGGSDIEVPLLGTLAAYYTPDYQMPALLMAGGSSDVWPDPSFTLVDFSAATDNLQEQLADDGHYVVRCEHTQGHDIPYSAIADSWEWIEAHRFGEPSPFLQTGIGALTTGCDVIEAD